MTWIVREVLIEQKDPKLAPFVVLPALAVAPWGITATTTVEGELDRVSLGRRSLMRWDAERWFMELRPEVLAQAGKRVGDRATLSIRLASTELPEELKAVLEANPAARTAWAGLSSAQQRMLREDLLTLKSAEARERRARKELLRPAPAPPPGLGLGEVPRPLLLMLRATHLPGRSCGPWTDVAVGLVSGEEAHPKEMAWGDAPRAAWDTPVEVYEKAGALRFRGKAVQGTPQQPFLYLTWIGRPAGGPVESFRRAKLRLDAIPRDTLLAAVGSGRLLGQLGLTDPKGMPLCASVLPPVIRWSPG